MNRSRSVFTGILLAGLFILTVAGCGSDGPTATDNTAYTTVEVYVIDGKSSPITNANVSISPNTRTAVTDSSGKAIFEDLPVQTYTFSIQHSDYPSYLEQSTLDEVAKQTVTLKIPLQKPEVAIRFPEDQAFVSLSGLYFQAEASDSEDGALPGDAIVWTSNVDGQIGTGAEIRPGSLTLGDHAITVTATDSDNLTTQDMITVTVVDYNPESYFPTPADAFWSYRHVDESISVSQDDSRTQVWELDDIGVSIDEDHRRISTMRYSVRIGSAVKEYLYTVTDYLEKDGASVRITSTEEKLEIWDGNPFGNANDQLLVVSEFTPAFILFEDVLAPSENSSSQQSISTEVTWEYFDPQTGSQNFTESFRFNSTTEIGQRETIYLGRDPYEVIKVTIQQGEPQTENYSRREWWLSKGLGIVRLTYNTFSVLPEANLSQTNLTNYSGKDAARAITRQPSYRRTPAVPMTIPAEAGPDQMRAILKIMRALAP